MIILGLTGSIGMGKSTTATMFADLGIPVHDADASVHALYSGKAVPVIEALFPGTTKDGAVDRENLGERVLGDQQAMKKLEAAIHPLVREEEMAFLEKARSNGADIVLLDIPLLFETGGDARVNGVVVVTAPPEVQRARVLARPGMTEDKLEAILARQTPDTKKRAKADFLVDTSRGMDDARQQVRDIVETIRGGEWKPPSRVPSD